MAYLPARRQGRLRVRMYLLPLGGTTGWPDGIIGMDLMTGDGDEWLRVGSIKLFADVSAGGKTAAMSASYADDADNRGIFIYGDGEIHGLIADYNDRGIPYRSQARRDGKRCVSSCRLRWPPQT